MKLDQLFIAAYPALDEGTIGLVSFKVGPDGKVEILDAVKVTNLGAGLDLAEQRRRVAALVDRLFIGPTLADRVIDRLVEERRGPGVPLTAPLPDAERYRFADPDDVPCPTCKGRGKVDRKFTRFGDPLTEERRRYLRSIDPTFDPRPRGAGPRIADAFEAGRVTLEPRGLPLSPELTDSCRRLGLLPDDDLVDEANTASTPERRALAREALDEDDDGGES